jgi:hypothetical protein
MIKIRHKNWYWGKWIYAGTKLDGSIINFGDLGFELYVEELHGWHHSEEFKRENLRS